jgi:hypothetical protein
MKMLERACALGAALALGAGLAVCGSVAGAGAVSVAAPSTAGYRGLGFDACSFPSVGQLRALGGGPFRAIAVYIGGANSGCPAPVTAAWVRGATAAGWSLIPTYVGLQAPLPRCGCRGMSLHAAFSDGQAAAAAAVTRLASLGIGRGNVVYDDMEGYTRGGSNTPAVLEFWSGWTAGLDRRGYVAGVYSSAASGIADLVSAYRQHPHGTYPADIWIADWNGAASASDPWVPGTLWDHHQRLHQFNGGETVSHGGVRVYADGDYCDGAVVSASSL